jgi:ubiquinone/menaquinone biosynthesis C-methylase UbiE
MAKRNKLLRQIRRRLFGYVRVRFLNDYRIHHGSVLPPDRLRRMTPVFQDDEYYLHSSLQEADRLIRDFGLNRNSTILEIGCSSGRLAIGLLRRLGGLRRYLGVDINKENILWCRRYLAKGHPGYRFIHLNLSHALYNPGGREMADGFRLPLAGGSVDIIYVHSVFANMLENDMALYLKEFHRLLKDTGKVFMTAFVEENVPQVSYNPEGYVMKCVGKLNITRFEKNHLFSLIERSGLRIDRFDHEAELDSQSGFCLSRAEASSDPLRHP